MNIGAYDIFCTYKVNIFDSTYKYWHILIMGQCNCRLIHNTEILMECLFKGKDIISSSIFMFLWIFIIDTIYLCCFYYSITLELKSSEYCSRIC
jgi:hypothetical protein